MYILDDSLVTKDSESANNILPAAPDLTNPASDLTNNAPESESESGQATTGDAVLPSDDDSREVKRQKT